MSKTVLITGASRGLGLALSRKFLDAGWKVYGISRTRKYWKPALAQLPAQAQISFHAADLTSESQVKKLPALFKGKKLDLVINNAGYGGDLLRLEETSTAEYQKIMNGNVLSAFLMCKYFVPFFRKQKYGTIFNISSMAGQRAVPKLAAYSIAKFGVLALSQAVAKENLDIPIKALTVCPGGMNTEMRAKIFGKEDAACQQSTEFVSQTIFDVYQNKIEVESGGDIVIRHGKITAIHPCPGV
jgi:meso-butanediol dehydrogenase/(S,S)-butanediol dehydrogenase/diacetyl reductase